MKEQKRFMMSTTDKIKARLDIVDVVSETVSLRKSGHSFVGFCPFHSNTRTPSFVVWPETGTWRCFGACNTGGDVFSFVMKREGWDFPESLRELARRSGVELEPPSPARQAVQEQSDRLREALDAAVLYFHNLLLNAPQARNARDYIAKRGLSAETVALFQLGYSLDEWHALEGYLRQRGFSRDELVEAGLLTQRDNKTVYDRFRDRLMFPIRDGRGRMTGFGARILGPGEPKYLNSPQSVLFDKSATLYALDMARAAVRQADRAVIVEGYMDAIAAHQAGFANVVACMGIALTEVQFKQLTRLSKKLVLALDPDTAGIQSMLRGLDVARTTLDRDLAPVFDPRGLIGFEGRLQADIRVAVMPGELDPDEVIHANPDQWNELIGDALPVIEYVIRTLSAGCNLNDPKEKEFLAQHIIPLIKDVASSSEQAHYAQRLARSIGTDAYVLQRQIAASAPPAKKQSHTRQPAAGAQVARRVADLEAYCLSALLRAPRALADIDDTFDQVNLHRFSAEDFTDTAHAQVFALVRQIISKEGCLPELAKEVRERVDESLLPVLDVIEAMPARPNDQPGVGAVKSALRLRHRNVQRTRQDLQALIQTLTDSIDEELQRYIVTAQRDSTEALRKLDRVMRSHEWSAEGVDADEPVFVADWQIVRQALLV